MEVAGVVLLLLLVAGGIAAGLLLLLASCVATSRIASARPSSPSGLFALSPAVGSLVARCTCTAGYLPLFFVCNSCLLVEVFAFAWSIGVFSYPSSFSFDTSWAGPDWCFNEWKFPFTWDSGVSRIILALLASEACYASVVWCRFSCWSWLVGCICRPGSLTFSFAFWLWHRCWTG